MRSQPTRESPVRDSVFGRFAGWAACLLVVLYGSSVLAQSEDPFEDLRIRIAQLEKDNLELRSALSKNSDDSFIPMISGVPPMPEEYDERPVDDDKMESLVDGLIRRMNAQSSAAFELRNQKIATLERQLAARNKPANGTAAKGNFGDTGLLFTSNDGNFKTHLGGTVHLDFIAPESTAANIVTPSGPYANQDSTNFRRIRFRADGTMYRWIDWVSEFEMSSNVQNTSNSNPSLADNGLRSVPGSANGGVQGGNTNNWAQAANVWLNFKDIPVVGNLRVGNQLDWFSLDHVQGARFADFMERATIIDVFTGPSNNGFTPGVSVFNNTPDKLAGLQLGVYKNDIYDSPTTFNVGNSFVYGGRAIWTPYYDEESDGRSLIHTAFGAEYRTFNTDLAASQNGDNIRLRSRGDLRIVSRQLTPNFGDTGNFFTNDQAVIDPEIAIAHGPWILQAEYTTGWFYGARTTQNVGGQKLGNVMMSGGYAEALYFLTGENKKYDRVRGCFGQVIPKNNFKPSEGTYGAWQTGLRYDWTDLNYGLITGGRNENVTLGLNWFLNTHIRFQFNTVFSYIDNVNTPNANPALNPAGQAAGALSGSKFTGDGLIMTVGTRMDLNF